NLSKLLNKNIAQMDKAFEALDLSELLNRLAQVERLLPSDKPIG
ncbi:hypothetical protein MCHI_000090, partial [Candidatus Magnetoovum chiemensis]